MTDIRERFIKILNSYYAGNQSKFARSIGVSQGNISNVLNRGTIPSSELIAKTAEALPQLNLRWLLTGSGEMDVKNIEQAPQSIEENLMVTNKNLSETIKSLSRTIENLTTKSNTDD